MFTLIKIDDGTISYTNYIVKLRNYKLTYRNPINDIESTYEIFVEFDSSSYASDKFIVRDIYGLNVVFDTYNDANTFAYHYIFEKYENIKSETKEIKDYVAKHSRKERKNYGHRKN